MSTDICCFDPLSMSVDATSLLVGARRSGKSTLMVDIMYRKRKQFDFAIGINTTEDSSHTMERMTSRAFIFDSLDNAYLRKLLDWQEALVKKSEHEGRVRYKRIALLMDDCGDDLKAFKTKEMFEIFKKGRHRKLFFMNASQYALELGPQLRDNLDYLFVFATSGGSTLKKLFDLFFASIFDGKFNRFMSTFRQLTADRSAIVLDFNRMKEDSRVQNCIFWYKADDKIPKYCVGKPIYRYLSNYFFDPETLRSHDVDLARIAYGGAGKDPKSAIKREEGTVFVRRLGKERLVPPPPSASSSSSSSSSSCGGGAAGGGGRVAVRFKTSEDDDSRRSRSHHPHHSHASSYRSSGHRPHGR